MATTKKSSGSKSKSASASRTTKAGALSKAKSTASKKSGSSKGASSSSKTASSSSKASSSKSSSSKKSTGNGRATTRSKRSTSGGSKTGTRAASTASSKRSNESKGLLAYALDAVTGLFNAGESNAIEMLKADHDKVEKLFEKVKANEDGDNSATFRKIKLELDVHAHIEERILYPHLLDAGDKELQKIVREGIEEHGQVKTLLSEIAELEGTSPTFKAKLKVLMENVEHHVEEEENEMFPMIEDQIPEDTLERLGYLLLAEKTKVMGSPAAKSRSAAAGTGRQK